MREVEEKLMTPKKFSIAIEKTITPTPPLELATLFFYRSVKKQRK